MQLGDDILINEIFPALKLGDLAQLCQSNKRLYHLCQNEKMWETRVRREIDSSGLKQLIDEYQKLPFMWKSFYSYYMSSFSVPVYINGDIVDQQPIYPNYLKLTINDLARCKKLFSEEDIVKNQSINDLRCGKTFNDYSIIFLNEHSQPILIYSTNELYYVSNDIHNIKKIVIVPLVINIPHIILGQERKPFIGERTILDLRNIALEYLTSAASSLPIYTISKNDKLQFIIQDKPAFYYNNLNLGKSIQFLTGDELSLMINSLEIPNSQYYSRERLSQIIAAELQKRGHFHKYM